ncbi:hypothetical protein [Bdellovibrio sp. ArHS]|uniref:hypothetical protein n=1 Tax=Bdellovibrio sp. ArHS TaxID=1569284 RepID=UPI000B1D4540|nr:hypothetical protein [Bdellovibrio sp. ArHS]
MRSLLQELKTYPQLLFVGAILSFEHLLTLFFWLTERPVQWVLSPSNPSVCWPLYSYCADLKPSSLVLGIILTLYGVTAAAGTFFWLRKNFRWGIITLWILIGIKCLIILQDYRLTGNYHYVPTLIALCFLLVPSRAYTLPFSFFVIYFTAGLLKLTPIWWNAEAINERLLPPIVNQIGVWYVLILELAIIFWLFSKKNLWFYFVFVQLVLFHLYSWHLTRFFYPTVMLTLLGILLVTRSMAPPLGFTQTFKKVYSSSQAKLLTAFFILLQIPQYLIPGDAALTGEGRMYAMIMYDGRTQCQPYLTLWKKNKEKEDMPLQPPWLITRTKCDAMVYWRLAQNICSWTKKDPSVVQVDLYIPVRYEHTEEWQPLVAATDVCNKELTYSSFFPNTWINKVTRNAANQGEGSIKPEED